MPAQASALSIKYPAGLAVSRSVGLVANQRAMRANKVNIQKERPVKVQSCDTVRLRVFPSVASLKKPQTHAHVA